MIRKYFGLVLFLFGWVFLSSAFADSITLFNGNTIEGKILERTDKYIKVESQGVTLTYYLDEIKSVNQSNSSLIDESAQAILEKVISSYNSLQTYKTEGKASMMMDTNGHTMLQKIDFSIILKKPSMYLISWTEKGPLDPGNNMPSAVWKNGDNAYFYESRMQRFIKMPSDDMALNMAAGLSMEAARVIPALFFYASGEKSPLKSWSNISREADQEVNGIDCFVISGASLISQKETLWASKVNYQILKYSRSMAPPPGGFKMPELSDEKLDARFKSMGMVMTQEQKEKMRTKIRKMMEMMKGIKLSGTATQNYLNISTPTLEIKDFQFDVPSGVVLKESFPTPDAMMSDLQKKSGDQAISRFNHARTENEIFCTIGKAGIAYFNQGNIVEAKKLADELTGMMAKKQNEKMYGDAIQDTNIIYGRMALANGNIEEAKKHLLAAGSSSGSGVMDFFGPNMTLAKDLLEKGQNGTVLKYFELCGKF